MTRPIFEPTPQRQVSALRYDKNQLQRRPAPTSDAGGIPYCYMGWFNGASVPSGNYWSPVDDAQSWDEAYVSVEGLVTQPGAAGQLLDPSDLDGDIDINHGDGPFGYYDVHAIATWADAAFAGFIATQITVNGFALGGPTSSQNFQDATMVLNESPNASITHIAHHILTDDFNQIGMQVWHNKGSDLDIGSMAIYLFQPAQYPDGGGSGQWYPI